MKENDNFILDIKRLGINGEGIGFYNRCAVFVNNAIPGEGHNVVITKYDGKMAFADSIENKRPSVDRIEPTCPYYSECGGCNTSHIKYSKMLELKRDILIESLNRYTKLNTRSFEIASTVPSEQIFGYRNRSQLLVRKKDDKFTVGMLKANSNIPVYIDDCKVQNPLINVINRKVLEFADELEIPPYLAKFNRGVLRYLVVRVNEKNEALVCFVCVEKNKKIRELAKKVIEIKGVISVYENFNTSKKDGVIFGEESNLLEGQPYIVEELGKIKYRIYPNTFFQLNTSQAEKMYDIVLKACKLSRKEKVLDAYCGVGTISLYLANMAKEVVGIEYSKDSIESAKQNAEINKIRNAKFLQGDAAELIPKLLNDGEVYDILVVDPPRTGLGEKLVNTIKQSKISKVIYVSCNPASLAKDLQNLSEVYNVNKITPIDMFPQTAHVECVALLNRKD